MTLDASQFRADFDPSSMGVITRMLSTLYANPERSVLREYIANGIDAHTCAGVTRPVQVTLPVHGAPTLAIQDFGEGLPLERLQDTFFRYAASTKNDDNSQIGALGIGAKSAFAVSKSWTVTSVHEGLRFVIASADDGDNTPLQTVIINGEPTEQPSGITVSIPINGHHLSHDWAASAQEMAYWFPKNSVTFAYTEGGGKTLAAQEWKNRDTDEKFFHGVTFEPSRACHDMTAVMGGVPYTVDSRTRDEVLKLARGRVADIVAEHISVSDTLRHMGTTGLQGAVLRASGSETMRAHMTTFTGPVDDTVGIAAARMVVLHRIIDRFKCAALDVPMGSIHFTDSREAVKGTPLTISALVDVIVNLLRTVNTDMSELYIGGDILADMPRAMGVVNVTANHGPAVGAVFLGCGVKSPSSGIERSSKEKLSVHDVLWGWSRPRVLVTGKVTRSALREVRNMERRHGMSFFYTEGDGTVDGFGDLTRAFKSKNSAIPDVLSYEQYLERVRDTVEPTPRDRDLERFEVSPPVDGKSLAQRITESESATRAALADPTKTVYAVKGVDSSLLHRCSALGMTFTVIELGRRKKESLEKTLRRELLDGAEIDGRASKETAYTRIAALAEYSTDDISAAVLTKQVSISYERKLQEIVESEIGSRELDGTEVVKFLATISRGNAIRRDDNAMFRVIVNAYGSLQNLPQGVDGFDDIVAALNVSTCPWPLIKWDTDVTDEKVLRHAVTYLKHA